MKQGTYYQLFAIFWFLVLIVAGYGVYKFFTKTTSAVTTKQASSLPTQEESHMSEKTFAMIKPDAVAAGNTGQIINIIEKNGFKILGMQKTQLTKAKAQEFYAVHKERPFFGELVDFVTSGPVILLALERENAIAEWRNLMGATDPKKATVGTLRKMFGTSIGSNATHGSDAPETAQQELALFFPNI